MSRKLIAGTALLLVAGIGPALAQQTRLTRPGKSEGPTRVELAVVVIEVLEIRDADESFDIDFILQARWVDERLAWSQADQPEVSVVAYGLEDAWHPRLVLVNEKDLDARLPDLVEVEPDGTVTYAQRFQGLMTTPLELKDFPGDSQRLPIQILSASYSPLEVDLVVEEELLDMLGNRPPSGWILEMGRPEVGVLTVTRARKEFAQATFYIEAQRESWYFVWTMMLPLTLIVFMAWMVFWIDPSLLPPQVGLSTAAVFSMIAYRTALRLTLPKVSYLTKAEVFILGCTVLVFYALAHAVAVGRFAKTGREEFANRMDRAGRWAYVLVFVLVLVLAVTW